jgi:hypothetical protein
MCFAVFADQLGVLVLENYVLYKTDQKPLERDSDGKKSSGLVSAPEKSSKLSYEILRCLLQGALFQA